MTADAKGARGRLGHPVVDGDGHVVESLPSLVEVIAKVAGREVADRFGGSSPTYGSRDRPVPNRSLRRPIPPWWPLPADPVDRATAFLPRLLYERLDDIGIDFSILYSSMGLVGFSHPDDDLRVGACKGVNTYLAEVLDGLGGRLTAAAAIPTHSPDEAIDVLEHAVEVLGFKAAMFNSYVVRPSGGVDDGPWIDVLALDSVHDYDPLWQRCVDLGVAVTVHSPTQGVGLRQSSTRYMYNHIGNFAASAEAFAKGVVLGGVAHRFPTLNFGFMECGVGWGVQLLCDLVDRWNKRGGGRADRLDPRSTDLAVWDDLLTRYGDGRFDDPAVRRAMLSQGDIPPPDTNDFRACEPTSPADLAARFDRFFFGCEADDAMIPWAFAANALPERTALQPVLGSDLGHWDVSDMVDVLPEALELLETGRLTTQQFRAFACDNTIRLHGEMNPSFFDGTAVAEYARTLLSAEREGAAGDASMVARRTV